MGIGFNGYGVGVGVFLPGVQRSSDAEESKMARRFCALVFTSTEPTAGMWDAIAGRGTRPQGLQA